MLRDVHGVSCDLLQATDETSPQSSVFIDFSDQPFYTWFNHWWFTTGKHGVGAKGGSLHKALQRVMAVWQKHGPYDGIYGFSQGGFMAAALCNRAVYHGLFGLAECPFRFAILGCSALAHVLRTVEVVNGDTLARMVLPVPASDAASLHIIGQTDWHRSASEDNARLFADSTSYVHGHGHEMPMKLMNDFELAVLAKRRDELQAKIEAANAELLGSGEGNILTEAQTRTNLPSWFFALMLEASSSQGTSIGLVALLILYGRRKQA